MRIPRAETDRLEAELAVLLEAERKRLCDSNRLLAEARRALDAGLPVFSNQILHDDVTW